MKQSRDIQRSGYKYESTWY